MRILALFIGAFCLLPSAKGADWPNWRGPKHDEMSTEKLPRDLPKSLPVAWNAEVGTGFSSVSVQEGRVLTMGNANGKDTIWCLNSADGRVHWKYTYDCPLDPLYYGGGPGSKPTIFDGAVYELRKKSMPSALTSRLGRWSGTGIW